MIRRLTTRLFAAGIAGLSLLAFAWTVHSYGMLLGDWGKAVWQVGQFYTYLAALTIAISFFILSLEVPHRRHAFIVGNSLILMAIMVSVYILLKGGVDYGTSAVRIKIEHWITPALVAVYWIACAPAKYMRLRDPLYWLIMPLVYVVYALTRWHFTHEYPYSIADVGKHGYPFVLKFVLITALAAMAAGYVIIFIDRHVLTRRGAVLKALKRREPQ